MKSFGLLGILAILLCGCGKSEPAVVESETSKQAATEASASWTPEQKAAFKNAHEAARNGTEDGGTGGTTGGSGGK